MKDKKLKKLLVQINRAIDIFEQTGDRRQFIALQDQTDALAKELLHERVENILNRLKN